MCRLGSLRVLILGVQKFALYKTFSWSKVLGSSRRDRLIQVHANGEHVLLEDIRNYMTGQMPNDFLENRMEQFFRYLVRIDDFGGVSMPFASTDVWNEIVIRYFVLAAFSP